MGYFDLKVTESQWIQKEAFAEFPLLDYRQKHQRNEDCQKFLLLGDFYSEEDGESVLRWVKKQQQH